MYVLMYVCVYIYMCVCVWVYVCILTYIYIYIHKYTHILAYVLPVKENAEALVVATEESVLMICLITLGKTVEKEITG